MGKVVIYTTYGGYCLPDVCCDWLRSKNAPAEIYESRFSLDPAIRTHPLLVECIEYFQNHKEELIPDEPCEDEFVIGDPVQDIEALEVVEFDSATQRVKAIFEYDGMESIQFEPVYSTEKVTKFVTDGDVAGLLKYLSDIGLQSV